MRDYFFTKIKQIQYKLLIYDLLLIAASLCMSYGARVYFDAGSVSVSAILAKFNGLNIIFFILHPMTMYVFGLYSPFLKITEFSSFVKMGVSIALSGVFAASFLFFFPRFIIGRKIFLLHLPLVMVFLYVLRLMLLRSKTNVSRKITLGLIGRSEIISVFTDVVKADPYAQYEIKYSFINDNWIDSCKDSQTDELMIHSVQSILSNTDIQALAIDSGMLFENEDVEAIYNYRFEYGKPIYDLIKLYETATGKVPINYINRRWFLSNPLFYQEPNQRFLKLKRIIDLSLAFCFLIFLWPMMLLTAIGIKIESRGPVFYIQERVGMNRNLFKCYKFRTMIHHAEAQCGPVPSVKNDPRLTRLGNILRKTRLDELPQLFNVLRGELSFVGPRPIREHFANSFSKEIPFYELRHKVKPGLTGWAQVNGSYAVPYGLESLQYELFYVQYMSLFLDLFIVFKTLQTVFQWKGK